MILAGAADDDRPALIAGDVTLSYAALVAAAERARTHVEAVAGERVAIIGPNVPAFAVALLAVWGAGAVAVPLGARSREHELLTTLTDAGAVAALTVETPGGYAFADALAELAPRLPALRGWVTLDAGGEVTGDARAGGAGDAAAPSPLGADIAAILYTSGSTGTPKGALMTHVAALHWARTVAELLALGPEDRTALVIPCSHAFGFASLLAALVSRGSVVFVDATRSVEPLAQALADATVLHGSPAVFAGLLEAAPEALRSVRTGLVGGAASPPGLIERLDGAGPRILNVFGMTEVGAACACRADDSPDTRYETAGRALPGYEVRTAADGELQVRGAGVTRGYHGRPHRAEGDWFGTGDLATIDDQGRVRISGRAEEVIHVGGFNVFPAEVENFLLTHPDVAQAAVLGAPHPRMGEVVKAFVVARAGAALTPGELLRFARPRIAGYKVPYGIEILDELPRLPSGKVDRGALA